MSGSEGNSRPAFHRFFARITLNSLAILPPKGTAKVAALRATDPWTEQPEVTWPSDIQSALRASMTKYPGDSREDHL
jgi:hypothetical protein